MWAKYSTRENNVANIIIILFILMLLLRAILQLRWEIACWGCLSHFCLQLYPL